jgi:hypothetical protein
MSYPDMHEMVLSAGLSSLNPRPLDHESSALPLGREFPLAKFLALIDIVLHYENIKVQDILICPIQQNQLQR